MDINRRAKLIAENGIFGIPKYNFVYKIIVTTSIYQDGPDNKPSSLYACSEDETCFRTMRELQHFEVGLKEQLTNSPMTVEMNDETYKMFMTYEIIIEQEK